MKAKIIKCEENTYWYKELIDCVFDVEKSNIDDDYVITHDGFVKDFYLLGKDDCEIIPETEYTYLDIDLPEWWDGRPIYGEAWNDDENEYEKETGYCVAYDNMSNYPFRFKRKGKTINDIGKWYRNFKPIPKQQTSAKVVITKDGKSREVELTDEQIKKLGI